MTRQTLTFIVLLMPSLLLAEMTLPPPPQPSRLNVQASSPRVSAPLPLDIPNQASQSASSAANASQPKRTVQSANTTSPASAPRAAVPSRQTATQAGQQVQLPPMSQMQAQPQQIQPESQHNPVFKGVLKQQFPLSPEQIVSLHSKFKETQRAVATPPITPPRPLVSSKVVTLAQGVIPPVVRLATGYVSSVVFVDETGAPWPVQAYDLGDTRSFNIQWDKSSHIMMLQGMKPYASGNMAVILAGHSTPVMLTLVNDQRVVDYRLELRIEGQGPNAQTAVINSGFPPENNQVLLNLLQGIPPQGSQQLKVTDELAQAWTYEGQLYLRTRFKILSPAWNATMKSADGTHVYIMEKNPLILATRDGQIINMRVEGL